MDETQTTPVGGLTAGLVDQPQQAPSAAPADPYSTDFTLSSTIPGLLSDLSVNTRQQLATLKAGSAAQDAADKIARQRAQGGLSASDLFRLAGAFATPTRNSSFMGTLANVNPVLGDIAQARETARQQLATQAASRQIQLQTAMDAARRGAITAAIPLVDKYATASKATPEKTAYNPTTSYFDKPSDPTGAVVVDSASKQKLYERRDRKYVGYSPDGSQTVYRVANPVYDANGHLTGGKFVPDTGA